MKCVHGCEKGLLEANIDLVTLSSFVIDFLLDKDEVVT
jgi:hypothetical protein